MRGSKKVFRPMSLVRTMWTNATTCVAFFLGLHSKSLLRPTKAGVRACNRCSSEFRELVACGQHSCRSRGTARLGDLTRRRVRIDCAQPTSPGCRDLRDEVFETGRTRAFLAVRGNQRNVLLRESCRFGRVVPCRQYGGGIPRFA